MQANISNSQCPLCKRPVAPNADGQPTRLCPQCQSMLQPIAPGSSAILQMPAEDNGLNGPVDANSRRSAAADVLFDVGLDGATPAGIPVEPAAVLFDAPESGFGSLFGETQQTGRTPNVPAKTFPESEANGSGQFEARDAFPQQAEAHQPEPPAARTPMQRRPAEAQSQSDPSSGGLRTVNLSQSGGQPMNADLSQGPVVRRPGSKSESEALSELAQSVGARNSGPVGDDTSLSDLAAATGLRRSTAPVEIPSSTHPQNNASFEGWEQSANEYPVLIPGRDPNYRFRMRWPLVVMLLLALVATAGYFLGFQKWITSAKPQTPQASNPIRKDTEAPGASVAPATHDPEVKPPETGLVKPPETSPGGAGPVVKPETPLPEASSPNNLDSAQAKYSLQAASFPKEVQAREFSDKLVRAGVPAYIMSIDIPHRGKWFRVRVGRFPSADEAGKYASQARQRARAAGINLELIVCDFEKT